MPDVTFTCPLCGKTWKEIKEYDQQAQQEICPECKQKEIEKAQRYEAWRKLRFGE